MLPDLPHILYIPSWYPRPDSSEGTFIEAQLLALHEVGIPAAVLIPGEATLRQALRQYGQGRQVCSYRSHPDIKVVTAPAVHPWPLRWSSKPEHTRVQRTINAALRAVEKYARTHGMPQVLFQNGVFNYTYLTEALSKRFHLPYWFMEHSGFVSARRMPLAHTWQQPGEVRAFVQGAARRFTVSQHHAALFTDVFEAPFSYCPNVLPAAFFKPVQQPAGPFHFVNVAILEPHKDHETLIRAFGHLAKSHPDARLTIAGEGSLRGMLEGLVSSLGLSANVRFAGHIPPEEVVTLLDGAHAFVLSSRVETFSVVLAEAMARGLPIITTDIPGARERVEPGMGLTFTPGDACALAAAMEQVQVLATGHARSRIAAIAQERYGSTAFAKCLLSDTN
jgi:glycosyltransferase involved in cell wall biosynthesis